MTAATSGPTSATCCICTTRTWLRATLEAAGFEVEVRGGYADGESMAGWVVVLARRR